MASEDIKRVIRDFTNYDIISDYYNEEAKEEIIRRFKKIMNEDDIVVRKFLQSFFNMTKELASEYSLIAGQEETNKEDNETDEEEIEPEDQESTEEVEEIEDEEPTEDDNEESELSISPPPTPKREESVDYKNKIFELYTEASNEYLY